MKINLFETFAGVGSQHTALRNIAEKNDIVNLVGISEWDMYAVLAYYKMNGYEFNPKYSEHLSDKEIREFFKELPYSLDSKKLSDRIASQPISTLRKLFEAHEKLGNIPDVTKLKGKDIIDRDVNLLTYSFPCQDLSTAGHGRGMSKDSDTRSGLLWEIERILDEINDSNSDKLPRYLLMENVTAIVDKRHKPDYDLWKEKLDELGYTSYDGTLNALDFGIPQTRKRFFCLSVLNPQEEYESEDLNIILEDLKVECRPLSDFLMVNYRIPHLKEEADLAVPNHTESRYGMFARERTLAKLNGNAPSLCEETINKYKVLDVHIRTLTTKQDRWNNGGMLEYFDKKFDEKQLKKDVRTPRSGFSKFRFLTNREAYLLMGFNENDVERVLKENLSREKMYRQAGNSIVVNVLEAIFKGIIVKEEKCN